MPPKRQMREDIKVGLRIKSMIREKYYMNYFLCFLLREINNKAFLKVFSKSNVSEKIILNV